MGIIVRAIWKDGYIRPLEPVDLKEGETYILTVISIDNDPEEGKTTADINSDPAERDEQ